MITGVYYAHRFDGRGFVTVFREGGNHHSRLTTPASGARLSRAVHGWLDRGLGFLRPTRSGWSYWRRPTEAAGKGGS